MERSSAAFGTIPAIPTITGWRPGGFGAYNNLNQYPTTSGGYYLGHQGVSSLDYEDMLFMLYALRYDVPGMVGVFSDYPVTTTAFANCVPKMDPSMPVSWNITWPPSPPPSPPLPPPPSPAPPSPPVLKTSGAAPSALHAPVVRLAAVVGALLLAMLDL